MSIELDSAKFPRWFIEAKKIVASKPDVTICLSDEEFFHFINALVPLPIKLSRSYIVQILYYDPSTKSTISDKMMEQYGEQFKDWWTIQRAEQQMSLYGTLKTNDKCFQRELEVLARRFHKTWGKKDHLKLDADVNANVVVTMNLCDKLRKLTKERIENE